MSVRYPLDSSFHPLDGANENDYCYRARDIVFNECLAVIRTKFIMKVVTIQLPTDSRTTDGFAVLHLA